MIEKLFKQRSWFVFLMFLFLGVFLYFPSLNGGFLKNFDDEKLIINSTNLQGLSFETIQHLFSDFVYGLYHPITSLSWVLELAVFGPEAFYFQLDNILLHAINAFLVFTFLNALLKNRKIACISAIVFLIHPMYVENVSWLSSRKDLMYVLFFLSGLISYLKYSENQKWKWLWLTSLFFILSLFSKSAAIVFPAVLLLIDWKLGIKSWKLAILKKLPFFILSGIFVWITIKSQASAGFINSFTGVYSVLDRLFMLSYSASYYLFKFLLPVDLNPKNLYPIKENGFLPFIYYASILVWLGFAFFFVKNKKSNSGLLFAVAFYLIIIAPTLKFVPTGNDMVSNRYAYLPYVLLFAFLAKFVVDQNKKWLFVIGIIWLMVLAATTYNYQKVYESSVTVWSKIIEGVPKVDTTGLAMAYNERGSVKYQEGKKEKALLDVNTSISLSNSLPRAFLNRGKIYQDRGNLKLALQDFNNAVDLSDSDPEALKLRAIALAQNGQAELAIEDLSKALEQSPKNVEYLNNRGIAYAILQKNKLAAADFNAALEIDKRHLSARVNRMKLFQKTEQFEKALTDLDYLDRKGINNSEIEQTKIFVLYGIGEDDNANQLLLKQAKTDEEVGNLGMMLFQNGLPKKSLYFFNRAIRNEQLKLKIHYQRSLAYRELGLLDSALADLTVLTSQMPENGRFFFEKGNLLLEQQKIYEACDAWFMAAQKGVKAAEERSLKYCE